MNCVANGKILKKIFDNIWIQPAAGDAGGSLGAALAFWYKTKNKRVISLTDDMQGSYLGNEYTQQIEKELETAGAVFDVFEFDEIIEQTAEYLSSEKAGWFRKNGVWSRALGSRSILADPRSKKMQKNLNLKVKFRESFRPFAPSVLREDLLEWFDLDVNSPYMLLVASIKPERKILMSDEQKNYLV